MDSKCAHGLESISRGHCGRCTSKYRLTFDTPPRSRHSDMHLLVCQQLHGTKAVKNPTCNMNCWWKSKAAACHDPKPIEVHRVQINLRGCLQSLVSAMPHILKIVSFVIKEVKRNGRFHLLALCQLALEIEGSLFHLVVHKFSFNIGITSAEMHRLIVPRGARRHVHLLVWQQRLCPESPFCMIALAKKNLWIADDALIFKAAESIQLWIIKIKL
mmetsp:Transcript_160913/g.283548  ORF Transcript_160913/g.283548 Transcript_160913/m.283548 type:complete len:215 (-) Transcript_160913:684-1328(-)